MAEAYVGEHTRTASVSGIFPPPSNCMHTRSRLRRPCPSAGRVRLHLLPTLLDFTPHRDLSTLCLLVLLGESARASGLVRIPGRASARVAVEMGRVRAPLVMCPALGPWPPHPMGQGAAASSRELSERIAARSTQEPGDTTVKPRRRSSGVQVASLGPTSSRRSVMRDPWAGERCDERPRRPVSMQRCAASLVRWRLRTGQSRSTRPAAARRATPLWAARDTPIT